MRSTHPAPLLVIGGAGVVLLLFGLLMAFSADRETDSWMGATIACLGAALSLAVPLSARPRRAITYRRHGDVVVIPTRGWYLGLTAIGAALATLAALTSTLSVMTGELVSRGRYSPVLLLGLWPLAAWLWYLVVTRRALQWIEISPDGITHRRGSRAATLAGAGDGRGLRVLVRNGEQVVVRTIEQPPYRELVVSARLFDTTADELVRTLARLLPAARLDGR